ncbi:putative ribonuclease H-like domain-containing protein [Tanacetum coccineum]
MQDELLQFRLQKVWRLVDLPKGKHAIRTKWVYRNKKDKRGIEVRNRQTGCTRWKGRVPFNMVPYYKQTIKEEVYVCQPPGFEDPRFPNKVYKVEKALYGLHQALRAWYKTLSTYLFENGFRRGTIDKTLFIKKDKGDILLVKQKDNGIFISQDKYVADILKKFVFVTMKTASTPKETNKALLKDEAEDVDVHLYRSMIGSLIPSTPKVSQSSCNETELLDTRSEGQPKLGLWYPRDSPFNLEAFFDSDYTGSSLNRKSTTGGYQFLGKRLISWQCKKQTIVANSTTEASSSCQANVVDRCYGSKIKCLIIDGISDEFRVKTGSCKVNAARQDLVLLGEKGNADFHQIVDFLNASTIRYSLTISPTIYASYIEQFWSTAKTKIVNNETQIHAKVDGKTIVILESSVMRTVTPLFQSMLAIQAVEGEGSGQPFEPQPKHSPAPPSHVVQVTNIASHPQKTQTTRRAKRGQDTKIPQSGGPPKKVSDEAVYTGEDDRVGTGLGSGPRCQDTTLGDADAQTRKLKKKVRRLEKKLRARTLGMKLFKIGTSRRKSLDKENVFKQGRNLKTRPMFEEGDFDNDFDDIDDMVNEAMKNVKGDTINAAGAKDKEKGKGVAFRAAQEESARPTRILPTIDPKDKGKGIMQEPEKPPKNPIKAQIQRDAEIAQRLFKEEQAQFEREQRIARERAAEQEAKDAALIEQMEDIQARMDADELLAERLQQEEREQFTIEEKSRMLVEMIAKRKRFFAAQRAEQIRNKPPTRAQLRNKMVTYLKHMGKYTHNQMKSKSFEEIQKLYEREQKWINDFVPMDFEVVKDSRKGKAEGSRKKTVARKRTGEKLDDESVKRQKIEDDAEKEELRAYLDIIPGDDEAVNVESLATKYPIVDWKTHVLSEDKMYYEIIRGDGSTKFKQDIYRMHDDFDSKIITWEIHYLFEPSEDDEIWKAQQDYTLISWRLFDSCGVHVLLMNTGIAIHMLIEKTYPLTQEMLSRMLSRRLEVDHECEMAYELLSTKVCKQFEKLMTQRYEISTIGVLAYVLKFQIKQSERGISINKERDVNDLLRMYDKISSSVNTPIMPPKMLGPDLNSKAVNESQYRGMIGSLMNLTTSRPNIQFLTDLYARHQANKESHLNSQLISILRIFRYLNGTPSLGLQVPKRSGLDLKE